MKKLLLRISNCANEQYKLRLLSVKVKDSEPVLAAKEVENIVLGIRKHLILTKITKWNRFTLNKWMNVTSCH